MSEKQRYRTEPMEQGLDGRMLDRAPAKMTLLDVAPGIRLNFTNTHSKPKLIMKTYFILLFATGLIAGLLSGCKPVMNEAVMPPIEPSKAKMVTDAISLTVPVWGNLASSADNVKFYNIPGSPQHKSFSTFNDSNAYDLNLADNREKGLVVVAPISGTVTALGTTFPGTLDGGSFGAVLIDHGGGLFTGYMHLATINVKSKTVVNGGQQIGTIGNKGTVPVHLHFAAYKKEGNLLVSRPVTFSNRPFSMPLAWEVKRDSKGNALPDVPLKVGTSKQLTGNVPFGSKGAISSATYFPNTFWSSDDPKTATTDGNGKITGVKKGTTTIRLKFSGQEFTFPVTVS